MFKRISSIVLITIVLSTSSFAIDLYVKVAAGKTAIIGKDDSTNNTIKYDKEMIYTMALGTKISDFDIELEYTYEDVNFTNNNIIVNGVATSSVFKGKSKSIILNAFYNIDLDYVITPYIGLGLGTANYTEENWKESYTVYQAMLGAKYAINENIDIALEYRYKESSGSFLDLSSKNILLNAVYKF